MMSGDESLVFIASTVFTGLFFIKWYWYLFKSWPPKRNDLARFALGCLPLVSYAIMLYTLKVLASFDVVDSGLFIAFYVLLGYAWLSLGVLSMFCFFDLSWIDDVVNLNNKAALSAFTGGFLGLTIIYSGANIGDGPGWWCVIFAGGLGLVTWLFLGAGICMADDMSERITVERDLGCGVRFGLYLLASGIILGRASGGDWTSFRMTIVEFYDVYDRWPVLLLAAIEIAVEKFYLHRFKTGRGDDTVFSSVFWGTLYVLFAIVSVMELLPDLPKNPIYGGAPTISRGMFL